MPEPCENVTPSALERPQPVVDEQSHQDARFLLDVVQRMHAENCKVRTELLRLQKGLVWKIMLGVFLSSLLMNLIMFVVTFFLTRLFLP